MLDHFPMCLVENTGRVVQKRDVRAEMVVGRVNSKPENAFFPSKQIWRLHRCGFGTFDAANAITTTKQRMQ